MLKRPYFIVLLLFFAGFIPAQETSLLRIFILDENKKPIPNAQVKIEAHTQYSDKEGSVYVALREKAYSIHISAERFQDKDITISSRSKEPLMILLQNENLIEKVVITAKESKGLTTSSVIDRRAMSHLQPSSFADVMELIPGKLSVDPNLTVSNSISLRESSGRPSGYGVNSLGVQFMVDDNVLNTNANLQTSVDSDHMLQASINRSTVATGVDMRTISTNDIERVEIVRGIPSAAYGDLTAGLVKIDRKIQQFPIQARFKADGFSKQYYLAKGFSLAKKWQITTGVDYLDAKKNPTDEFENYKRITASVRSKLNTTLWRSPLEWKFIGDMSHNVDNKRYDPDNGYAPVDRYTNRVVRLSMANNFLYQLPKTYFFNRLTLNTSVRLGLDRIEQVKLIQQAGLRSVSLATETGENVGYFPELKYISQFYTDGKPLDISAFLKTEAKRNLGDTSHHMELGADWRFSKNLGEGQVWNPITPPSNAMGIRQRQYKDIPAWQNLSVFLGDNIQYHLGNHRFHLYMGLRLSKLLGVDRSYNISKEIFVEPRANFQYSLPSIEVNNHPLRVNFTLGYGEFYKQPTLAMMYPNKRYWDYPQLNYYHNDAQYRYVNFMTYVQGIENKNLTATKNTKKELRVDISYRNHELFITLFRENMLNGFRSVRKILPHHYKLYDVTKVDINQWTQSGPNLSLIPYEEQSVLGSYFVTENGSATLKEGVEMGYTSPRIQAINTRFTLKGAWFKTQYRNTVPVIEIPIVTILGRAYPYYGVYQNDLGFINENINYNLMVDTYLPNLGFTISASLQGTLYDYEKRDQRIPEPISYYDTMGVLHSFLPSDKADYYKQWLVRNVSATDNHAVRMTHTIIANIKVTKTLYRKLQTSMFVSRLFNYQHPYYFYGKKVYRKTTNTPYFGMELNYNF